MSEQDIGRVPDGPGLSQAEPKVSALTGFDPSRMDDTDWHVLAQNIANFWSAPEERAIAYQAAAEAMKSLRKEMERWGRNEHRNCINWGPCSRNDGRMCDSDGSGEAGETGTGSTVGDSAGAQHIAQEVSHD